RLPYDPAADVSTQVAQSMQSSLEHLGTDHVDSYVLHGPASGYGWTDDDAEAWAAMVRERDAGRTRLLGVSNVSLRHLAQLAASGAEPPAFVQNRCFARLGWDRAVRAFCAERKIVYQGFSLLTANPEVLGHPRVADIAARRKATPAQFAFRVPRLDLRSTFRGAGRRARRPGQALRDALCLLVLAALLMVLALAVVLTPMWVFVVAGLVGIVRPNDQVLRNSLIGETIPPDDLI